MKGPPGRLAVDALQFQLSDSGARGGFILHDTIAAKSRPSQPVLPPGHKFHRWQALPEAETPGISDIASIRTLRPTKEDPHPALASGVRRSLIAWLLVATLLPALVYEPAVIYAGTIYNPWLVALVGGISIMVVSIIDYLAVKKVFELPGVASIKRTGFYLMTVRWFRWRPWETIAVFAFAPLPYDLVRVLAPSTNYPLGKYVTANVTGRVFLYYLLALGGTWLPIPPTYLIPIVMFISLAPLLYVLLSWRLFGRRRL